MRVLITVSVAILLVGCMPTPRQRIDAEWAAIRTQYAALAASCKAATASPELDSIRDKVALYREPETQPTFAQISNTSYPTLGERAAIAKWAAARDRCVQAGSTLTVVPASESTYGAQLILEEKSFGDSSDQQVTQLVLALYQGKLTYGEFAQKRYEVIKTAADTQRQYREDSFLNSEQRRLEAFTLVRQQFAASLRAWAIYIQAINARQPVATAAPR
jgi:hypothetical protein